jgi:DNA-binding transcriptional regulator YiaG
MNLKNSLDNYKPMAYVVTMTPKDLKKWREANGYSQSGLADALSVHIMTVSRWERGAREIPSFLHLALKHLGMQAKGKIKKGKGK